MGNKIKRLFYNNQYFESNNRYDLRNDYRYNLRDNHRLNQTTSNYVYHNPSRNIMTTRSRELSQNQLNNRLEQNRIRRLNRDKTIMRKKRLNPYLIYPNSKKNKNAVKKISNFECCVCYSKYRKNRKRLKCKHQLCKKCYSKIDPKKCPLCRKSI